MFGIAKAVLIVPLLIAGLLTPKLSALVLHVNPNITTIVICAGNEMVTIHLDADGKPVETAETAQSPCVLADPGADIGPAYTRWTTAPKTYHRRFVQKAHMGRSQAERGLLADLRGPPFVT